jgi:protein AFG1
MTKGLQLLTAYEALASKGKLIHDPRQLAALQHLDQLGEHVLHRGPIKPQRARAPPPPSAAAQSGGLFSRMFSSPPPPQAKPQPQAVSDGPAFNGVYLYGTVGCGKTMLMDMFYSHLSKVDGIGKQVKRTHFHPFMLDVHARLHRMRNAKGGRGTEDPLPIVASDIVRENWIICFDELLVTDVADAMILRHLFANMFSLGAVMVATSNAAPKDLYKNGINRDVFIPFIKLVEDRCKIHNMSIKIDYRGKIEIADANKGVFFGLTKENTPSAFEDARKFALSRLLGINVNEVPEPAPREITVQSGRKVQIKRTYFRSSSHGSIKVAEFDFNELFGGSMSASAADFLAMSESFSSILVLNVPEIKGSDESIARRFIIALDVWYDLKKTVVFISQVSPRKIFSSVRKALGLQADEQEKLGLHNVQITITPEGGSTTQFTNTMIQTPQGKEFEWSATGLKDVSLAKLGQNRHDEDLLFKRATSRLVEMQNRGNLIVLHPPTTQ